jgi:translation initiation factor 3 subunit M
MATGDLFFEKEICEDEQADALASFIEQLKGEAPEPAEGEEAPLSKYAQDVAALNEQSDAASIAKLLDTFIPDMATVFEKGEESDVEGAYSILYDLCRKLDKEKDQGVYAQKLLESVTGSEEAPELRLKLVVNLYNSVHPGYGKLRFRAFCGLLDYCTKTGQVALVAKHLGDVAGRVAAWKLSNEEEQEVYLKLAGALRGYDDGSLAQNFLVKYLGCLTAKQLPGAAEHAITACVAAIQNPTMFACDELLELPAVAALAKGDDKGKAVHRLLEIFAREKLDAFEEFAKSNQAVIDSIGLTKDACVDKLRMLSMAILGAEMGEIPYSTVQETLQLESDMEVERWVIKVTRAQLMTAKIDQLRKLIVVGHTSARNITSNDWEELGARINGWRACLQDMSHVIRGAKENAVAGVL